MDNFNLFVCVSMGVSVSWVCVRVYVCVSITFTGRMTRRKEKIQPSPYILFIHYRSSSAAHLRHSEISRGGAANLLGESVGTWRGDPPPPTPLDTLTILAGVQMSVNLVLGKMVINT